MASFLSLVVLIFNGFGLIPVYLALLASIGFKGILGNIVPIAWSTIGDTERKNERFFYAMSEAAYAVGFLILLAIKNPMGFDQKLMLFSLVALGLIIAGTIFFRDRKDKECLDEEKTLLHVVINEPRLVKDSLKQKSLRLVCYSFLFLECSLYSILILYTDFPDSGGIAVASFMMYGYIFGSIMMKFFGKISNRVLLRFGFILSIGSLVPYILLAILGQQNNTVLIFCYTAHSIGNAILCPTFLKEVSSGSPSHEKGKKFGLLDSSDTLAVLIASMVILFITQFNLPIIYLVMFSFITIIIAGIFYWRYELCIDS